MAKRFPLHPAHPERTCWGCDTFCSANAMLCGNGSERSQHPVELFGDDWAEWSDEGRPPERTLNPEHRGTGFAGPLMLPPGG